MAPETPRHRLTKLFLRWFLTGRPVPVDFLALSSGPTLTQFTQIQFGAVRADVSSVTVRLGNDIVLTLHPVKVWGVRMVAFVVPPGGTILDVTAHSRHRDIATAIPFNDPDGTASFGAWLRPGQHGLDRASGRIAAGTAGGQAWSVTANLGPWGICLDAVTAAQVSAGSCVSTTSTVDTSLMFHTDGSPQVAGGTAAAAVTRIVVRLPGGASVQVRPVTIGQQKFFAFPVPTGKGPLTWTAYDSSGKVVGSGAG